MVSDLGAANENGEEKKINASVNSMKREKYMLRGCKNIVVVLRVYFKH